MASLDQSFSANNFSVIFNLLNRKGKIDVSKMSDNYQTILEMVKFAKSELSVFKKKKKSDLSAEDKSHIEILHQKLRALEEQRVEALDTNLDEIASAVSSRDFKFTMSKRVLDNNKEEFTIDTSQLPAFYAVKQLQYNMKKTFGVEMSNRHTIMESIKILLNMKMPIYIIRTDISSFFESIPQDKLFAKINDNTLLSYKSKSFIRAIINQYEGVKDVTKVVKGKGIPRGVGISSMLSEIYMKDIDRKIINRKEVIYYVRYVDDIFLIMMSTGEYSSIEYYYEGLVSLFNNNGLQLKKVGDEKCLLLDLANNKSQNRDFEYLGYCLYLNRENDKMGLITQFGLSSKKRTVYRDRIDSAFKHFEAYSRINLKQARRDLFDSLDIISGNIRLNNSKAGVKVGLYYNNDQLDEERLLDFDEITKYLHEHSINLCDNIFLSVNEKIDFINSLKRRIDKIDFAKRWRNKIMCKFPIDRVESVMKWL